MNLIRLDPHLRVDPSWRPRTPGEVLRDDYMLPRAMTLSALARRTGIRAPRLRRIVIGEVPMCANAALRLAVVLNTSALYWMLLQVQCDLERERRGREFAIKEPSASSR
ncbi:HigA family addiction module antitoxin [Dyella silvae]|uniref:HigA family addiction module antitoxin n=1 Tax=Dyella silvae TaxID=2994424 RepID=UPI002263F9EC|nr:HigA family addiction module antitoxin [Dyella silvae]